MTLHVLVHAVVFLSAVIIELAGAELFDVPVVMPQHPIHSGRITGMGGLDHRKRKQLIITRTVIVLIHRAIQRGLTTSSTAIFIPFITQELFQTGAALYYGLNALSNNMILCDRKQLKNPNGLILGTPGSGKSFAAKREMTNAFLITDDDIIICDPEAEYFSLVQRLNGQVIRLSPTGKGIDGKSQYVNPMDINLNYSEDDSPLALKSDFILSLCELVIGGKEGLQPIDKTVIDRAVRNVYRPFLANPDPANMPILGDLYDELLKQPEPEAARIASALELYVSGSLNVFNHRTNVELSNRLVCFDIIGVSLGLSMNFEAVTARYVDVRLERKKEVLDAYHGAVKQADPAKAEKAEPKKAKSAAKKKSSDLEL